MALEIEERRPGFVPEATVVTKPGFIQTNVEFPLRQETTAAGLCCWAHEAPLALSISTVQPSAQLVRRSRGFPLHRRPFLYVLLETGIVYTASCEVVRMTTVELISLSKYFRDVAAVANVTLRIEAGEFLVVVGPTGCGKTTLLRLIAGLEKPSNGEIRFDGQSMQGVSPNERRVRMVFQDYALYPHLRVYQDRGYSNLGFPLNVRGMKGDALRSGIENLAARIGIAKRLFPRRPRELSSGEQQKVAFGRALSLPPRVLLLDEPFSNLDPISRIQAQKELKAEHAENHVTTIHVTHSLAEAFMLADRVAVMDEGQIVQVGTPEQIKAQPANDLVKALIESSQHL